MINQRRHTAIRRRKEVLQMSSDHIAAIPTEALVALDGLDRAYNLIYCLDTSEDKTAFRAQRIGVIEARILICNHFGITEADVVAYRFKQMQAQLQHERMQP